MTAPTPEELNAVGIKRIIESAARLAKDEDEAGRRRTFYQAAAVIATCEMPDAEREEALKSLREALRI